MILQEYIETDGDVRVMVLNNEIVGSMKRKKVNNIEKHRNECQKFKSQKKGKKKYYRAK